VLDFAFSLETSLPFSLSLDVLAADLELVDGLVEVDADVEAEATSTVDAFRLRSGLLLDEAAFELEALADVVAEDFPVFPVCKPKK
jgi:hypothetical protein